MRRANTFTALGLICLLLPACADDGPPPPVPVTLANNGSKKMVFEVVAGTSATDSAKRVVRVILEPGKKATYTLPVGKYTLFPREYMYQGTFGLAFYPFRLKAGKAMVVSLDSRNHPIFTGNALWHSVNTQETSVPSDVAAHGSASAAKAAKATPRP